MARAKPTKVGKDGKPTKPSPWADSVKQAAAMLGCEPSVLLAAKSAGCPAFRSGRINIAQMREWLVANPPDPADESKEALERRKLLAQCKLLEVKVEVEQGKLMSRDEVRADLARIGGAMRSMIIGLQNEAPKWEGMRAADLVEAVTEYGEKILEALHSGSVSLYGDK